MARASLIVAAGSTLALVAAAGEEPARAHKPITSKYSYNEHVFPVIADRCGRCHYPGGPTPMSLLSYKEAVPWAESIREQLTAEAMPPWYVDQTGPAIKGGHLLPPREMDIIVTWASGGTPEGDPSRSPAPMTLRADWRAGPPDLVLQGEAVTVPAGTIERTHTVTLTPPLSGDRWVRALDVLPGTPSMVRRATIAIDGGQILCLWLPGHDAGTPTGAAFKLPAGARLTVRIDYRKHWQDEQVDRTDRSAIGLYFTDPPVSGRAIESLEVRGARRLTAPVRILAVTPAIDRAYSAVRVNAVLPSGARVPLLVLNAPRPGWNRRYWLAEPIEIPADATIEITSTAATEGPAASGSGATDGLTAFIEAVGL